jgi:hypothetical protein
MFIKTSTIQIKKRARCGRRVLPTRNGVLKVGIIGNERKSGLHNGAIIQQFPGRAILKNVTLVL